MLIQGARAGTKPVVLVVLDGWGLSPVFEGNPIAEVNPPYLNKLWNEYPHTALMASGQSVGLPYGESGNSEVGHFNIGSGRVVYEELPRINAAIKSKEFFDNEALIGACRHVKEKKSCLHIMGICSAGGVHGHVEHILATLDLAKKQGVERVCLHLFADGRDAGPNEMIEFVERVEKHIKKTKLGRICTLVGRSLAMDRDSHWETCIKRAYELLVSGSGELFSSAIDACKAFYERGKTDEFMPPAVIATPENPLVLIDHGDALVFTNYRADRAIHLSQAFVEEGFFKFERSKVLRDLYFVTMSEYDQRLQAQVAFPSELMVNTLTEVIAKAGLKQLHIAESEKYAHVTYFFNGGHMSLFEGEEQFVFPSPEVKSFDQKPEMSALEITDRVVQTMGNYDFILINYANPDMVGHTGNAEATAKAVGFVDECLGRVVDGALKLGGAVVITGDHGNAEELLRPGTGEVDTGHSSYPVPFIVVDPKFKKPEGQSVLPMQGPDQIAATGVLADVAPTVLELMCIEKPEEMTGFSLISSMECDA